MKRKICYIAIIICLLGCTGSPDKPTTGDVKVFFYRGHEYLTTGITGGLLHSASCPCGHKKEDTIYVSVPIHDTIYVKLPQKQ